jgi:hypothetical protein
MHFKYNLLSQKYKIDTHSTSGNTHIKGTHKNNNDNITAPMLIVLNKTTQETRTPQEENSLGKKRKSCSQKRYFSVNYENAIAL